MREADPPNIDGARETAARTIRDGNRASDVVARLRGLFSRREFTPESFDRHGNRPVGEPPDHRTTSRPDLGDAERRCRCDIRLLHSVSASERMIDRDYTAG